MDERKNPEEYLKIIKAEADKLRKGQLRIFFGMAAGVGKTYQMLDSAQQAQNEGHHIVIGYIETHNRKETVQKCDGLSVIKRKELKYQETHVEETDIDEIIRQKPEIVLVDELAHTNAPGSRHKKRYQDVLELLNYGIDVWTTLNVQHLESRATIVEQITGIKIGETVPDYIVEMADRIEIIDITPEDLQKRLKEGKVYAPEKTETALNNFFREGNITALRELSLQVVAKLVDKDITSYKAEHNILDSWKATDKLLVAVGPSPFSAYLIKWTKKTAFSLNAEWIAVNIESSRELTKEQKVLLGNNLDLARKLGAKIVTTAEEDIVSGLIRTAKLYNVSQIVVGKPLLVSFKNLFKKNITDRLIRESSDIDVYVVSQPGAKKSIKRRKSKKHNLEFNVLENSKIVFSLIAVTCLNFFVQTFTGYLGIALIYLLYVVIVSSICNRKAAITVSVLSAFLWNYFFVPPLFTFEISKPEDILGFIIMIIVAIVSSSVTSKLHIQEAFLRKKESNLEILYELSKEIVNNADFNDMMNRSAAYIERYFDLDISIFIYNDGADECKNFPDNRQIEIKEKDIAYWVIKNGIPAGKGTDTLSDSDYYFYPIKSSNSTEGTIVLNVKGKSIPANEEFLKTVSFIIGSAIMKEKIIVMNQNITVEKETEKLYSLILKSISHELKTPVTSIALAVNGLCDEKMFANKPTRDILISDIKEANERLNRIISNLLDMTRIESGRLKLNLQWNDLNDLLSVAITKYTQELKDYHFIKEISDDLPPVKLDFGLIEQVISNIIYNAIIHTKSGTKIVLKAYKDERYIYLKISDNGGGIKKIEKIFAKFYKEDQKKTGGLGIGLSICKAITDFHQWELTAENNAEGGTTFTIILPYNRGEAQ